MPHCKANYNEEERENADPSALSAAKSGVLDLVVKMHDNAPQAMGQYNYSTPSQNAKKGHLKRPQNDIRHIICKTITNYRKTICGNILYLYSIMGGNSLTFYKMY